ncbi:thioesterase family protein [Aquamicrobium defluvii]|uniref:Thioesterase n=1 Tax=Aquamicrobium defluvii TaxID=69279 RepID=A0A011UU12_9HYPH|nr:thioesterase family protein [Aquamicrobium defluvii]EXL09746.1 thioesterase [Aquamicrobium defluvii]EZQ16555.1 thioesterase [Halopseudomonas bauzanensis]TDR37984.1 (3S)-malyl-CoA thioesterase [Aquamicrobium defluvii]
MSVSLPFVSRVMEVEKDWIDYNGHMNMAYYNVLFDRGSDEVLDLLGMGAAYAQERKLTIYTAEIHVCYVRELHLNDRVTVSFQVLDSDDKRLRSYQEIRHADGWLAATAETLSLHVDMAGPKVAAFPPDVASNLESMRTAHAALPFPERAGRSIGIRRKTG